MSAVPVNFAKIVQSMLSKVNPTSTAAWQKLNEHHKGLKDTHLGEMFANNPDRFSQLSREFKNILWDFSKNLITEETLDLFEELFNECRLSEAIEAQFSGQYINETENRAVLHTALRNFSGRPVFVDGEDVMLAVKKELQKMKAFSEKLDYGEWRGMTGSEITDVVNIGIGGSDLGPAMVYEALKPFKRPHIRCHYVSNVDQAHLYETLDKLSPHTTLFIIASKSFTTDETMTNARTARRWFLRDDAANEASIPKHFVAVSTNEEKVREFGIDPENMFVFWDWVGGRYSVWSSIGLSLCIGLGYEYFEVLLRGAHAMDEHFRTAAFKDNIPMLMAAIGIWYTNFWGAETEAIIPYQQNLSRFAAYFQQGNMESNGKSIDRSGKPVSYHTGPVVWGEPGTNGQHAFFQLLHQGTRLIPCDFIGFVNSRYPSLEHQLKLMANFFAQTEALMEGRSYKDVQENAKDSDLAHLQIPYRVFEGNKPTTTILGHELEPFTLGALIAAYEQKIFTQGVIWNIYSFDQWGVELGKVLAKKIQPKLAGEAEVIGHDPSTTELINYFLKHHDWP